MADRDEDTESLKALQRRTREALRAGLEKVGRLEGTCDPKSLEAWISQEISRYGGRRVEVDES